MATEKTSFIPEENNLIEVDGKIIGKFIETPLEFLERFLLDHEIYKAGLESYITFRDELASLAADDRMEELVNIYINDRPIYLNEIDFISDDIKNLKLEMEAEKASPSDVPMGFRLMNRLGHL